MRLASGEKSLAKFCRPSRRPSSNGGGIRNESLTTLLHKNVSFFRASLLWWLLCGLGWRAGAGEADELIKSGDAHDQRFETKAALADYLAAIPLATNRAALYWKIAKQYVDSMGDATTEAAKKKLSLTALDYALKSVAAEPQNERSRVALAIAYGKASNFADNRTRVKYSREVREQALEAIRLDPKDDLGYFVLGRWNYEVAGFNSFLRALVKVMYGGLPSASNDEAIRNYKKAIQLAPDKPMHHYHLGRAYQVSKRAKLAAEEYRKALALPVRLRDDFEVKEKAKLHLKEVEAEN